VNAHPVALIDAHEIGIYEQTSESDCTRDRDEQDTLENVDLHRRFSERVGNASGPGGDSTVVVSNDVLYAGKSSLAVINCVYVYCAQGLLE
jgi:hypothetical protein